MKVFHRGIKYEITRQIKNYYGQCIHLLKTELQQMDTFIYLFRTSDTLNPRWIQHLKAKQ